jgi:CBS domain-containing protein
MRARALPAWIPALTDEELLPVASFARPGPVVDLHDRVSAVFGAVGGERASPPVLAVVDGERFVGVVTGEALARAASSPQPLPVAAIVERGIPTIDAWSSVAAGRAAVERSRRGVAAVTSVRSRFLGLVAARDLTPATEEAPGGKRRMISG